MPLHRFGPFLLDTARRELRRDGVPVDLTPKAFDVIVYLLEHRDRAVGRDELIAGVWGRIDVSDNVLDQIVLRARRALGGGDEGRRYIATRPRFGFAWEAAVETVDPTDAPTEAIAQTDADEDADPVRVPGMPDSDLRTDDAVAHRTPRRISRALFVLVPLCLLLAGALGWLLRATAPVHIEPPQGDLLVLPFAVPAEAQADWARLGLMDLVAQRLRDAGGAVVPSDNAIALVRGADPAAQDDATVLAVAARAGVPGVVRGDVRFGAGRWQVTLRLLDPDRPPVRAEANAAAPLDAARAAADRLALTLGLRVRGLPSLPGDAGLALRLQQVDAAILGDAIGEARTLLAGVPASQRTLPEVRRREAALQFRTGDLDGAQHIFETLLDSVTAADDPLQRAGLLNALGNIALRRGDAVRAQRQAEAAIALTAALPPSPELGRAYTGRAIAHSTQEAFASALADFARARIVLDSIGDRLGVARVDLNIGILDARRERYADAEPVLATAADQLAAFNDLTSELYARVTLAQVRLGLLDPLGALAGDARLAELVAREPNPERGRYANVTRAQVLAANGRLRDTVELLAAVRNDATLAGDVVLLGAAQAVTAALALPQDAAAAARDARTALNAPWGDEDPRAYAATWWLLVRAEIERGDVRAASAALDGFAAWAPQHPSAAVGTLLHLTRAEVAAARGDGIAARAAFDAALAAADALRLPADLLRVCERYADWLLLQGDAATAAIVAVRIARWAERDYGAALLTARVHRNLNHVQAWHEALGQARRLAGERMLPEAIADAQPPQ